MRCLLSLRFLQIASLLFVLAALIPIFAHAGALVDPPKVGSSRTGVSAGPCDTSDLPMLLGAHGPLASNRHAAIVVLAGRIVGCRQIISQFYAGLPTAPPIVIHDNPTKLPAFVLPSPLPSPDCKEVGWIRRYDVADFALAFNMLGYCAQWVARNVPSPGPASISASASPSPIPFQTPQSSLATKTIYVLALASDAPTSAQIALRFTDMLTQALRKKTDGDVYTNAAVQYQVLAAPTWTVAQFQLQCASDPSTAGAVIVLPPSTDSASWNFLLVSSWTRVGMQVMIADCRPTNTSYVNSASYLTWISRVEIGTGERLSFSLSTALGLYSGILASHPQHTNTYSYPTPTPNPVTGVSGTVGSATQTGYTTGTNTGVGYAAGVAVAALTPLASTNLGLGAGVDAQTAQGIIADVPKLETDMLKSCPPEGESPKVLSPQLLQCRWFDYFNADGSGYVLSQ
jgi:hypothetical protein